MTPLEKLDRMASQAVSEGAMSGNQIRETITALRIPALGLSDVTDEEAEGLARDIEERIGVSMGSGAIVDEANFVPWLNDAKAKGFIEDHYWPRYEKLLQSQGLPGEVIRTTDELTDRILGRLGNPRDEGNWDRRGMVVGHVQSGKTANYTGLISKAADAGYRLVIVIAGIHNNLRNQTQARIDEGFIGRDTGSLAKKNGQGGSNVVGVGKFDGRKTPVSLTSVIRDFNKATATTNTSQISSYAVPVVLVIKKNTSTLKNLIEWLREHSAQRGTDMVDQPMLLIDDEADNASINISYSKDTISRINGQIRDLLRLFRRSCYVGYTATPFANIFIDPDNPDDVHKQDLFPRNFIIGLDAPSNYFGASKLFLDGMPEDGKPTWLRFVADNGDLLPIKHRIDHHLGELPPSMIEALRTFIVARAIRNLRGQSGSHASMLVNASRFTGMQEKLRNRLRDKLDIIRDAVRVDGSKGPNGLRNPEIAALKAAWENEYFDAGHSWEDVQAELFGVVAPAKVVQVNSRANELDYSEAGELGLTIIAVGGFSLSRGLTLEGLTVSYFLRNSVMYDTLMQMGRWFGYRRNYEDICRVWMPKEAADWYAHIAEASDELHEELRRMERAKATPEDFGLAVRSHPSSLMVTARNKIGAGQKTVLVGLSNAFVETSRLNADRSVLDANRKAAKELMDDFFAQGFVVGQETKTSGGYLFENVPVDAIDDFLLKFRNADTSILTETEPLRRYIGERAADELSHWDVLVTSVREKEEKRLSDILGPSIGPLERGIGDGADTSEGILAISGKRMRVASRGVERTGVDPEKATRAETEYLHDNPEKKPEPGKRANYPDWIYRNVRNRPLFILYLVKIEEPKQPAKNFRQDRVPDDPLIAWGISFPRSFRAHSRVEYIVNPTKYREMFGEDDMDDDAEEDDDG